MRPYDDDDARRSDTVRELLRRIANQMDGRPDAFTATEAQVEILGMLIELEPREAGDDVLAALGSLRRLNEALDRLDEIERFRMERDNASLLHDVGRWHAKLFRQPATAEGRVGKLHVRDILAEASRHRVEITNAIEALLEAEAAMEPGLRDVLRGWLEELERLRGYVAEKSEYADEFWAGQMVAEAAYYLTNIAWPAVAIFGYSKQQSVPTAAVHEREDLLIAARDAGRFVAAAINPPFDDT